MMEYITSLEPGLLYPALLMGLIVAGGFVLLPAMYLTILGVIKLGYLFVVTIIAAIISDSIWYFVGRNTGKERAYSWKFIQKRIGEAKKFSTFFSKHGALMVFMTKFIYGTRIASHVLAGMHKIRFRAFVLAVSAGTAIWFLLFYFLLRTVDLGVGATKATAFRIQILFLAVAFILLFLNWFTGTYIRKRMLGRKTT